MKHLQYIKEMKFEEYEQSIDKIDQKIFTYKQHIKDLEKSKYMSARGFIKSTYLNELYKKHKMVTFYEDDYSFNIDIENVDDINMDKDTDVDYVNDTKNINDMFIKNKNDHNYICSHVEFDSLDNAIKYIEMYDVDITFKSVQGTILYFLFIDYTYNTTKNNKKTLFRFLFNRVPEEINEIIKISKKEEIEIPEEIKKEYSHLFDGEEIGLL